ncbi:hypothetical protein PHYSODRAFT_260932 [Phytophthora sojae]|uniref:Uncharacterized protein n=1 Tax=Phytophthora sojae (strain P6497) TaxID=1094619 RepID=G4ZTN0_PHYSP|nr:hypothetical protein PHYSODRAFT_260932 [Phytophthora sojae]EGZ12941.1 hypothetical protein PHYSODRAFT_260932 [Phytophthora sojae]|eukprot:XP_009530370.1 hypothetical protein PHYSODRAFT_260932 [Phytophthora sojae]
MCRCWLLTIFPGVAMFWALSVRGKLCLLPMERLLFLQNDGLSFNLDDEMYEADDGKASTVVDSKAPEGVPSMVAATASVFSSGASGAACTSTWALESLVFSAVKATSTIL